MPPVLDSRQAATPYRVSAGDTLASIVERHRSREPELTWQLLAVLNWGTDDPIEVNRALIEIVGCAELREDPSQTVLDPARGTNPQILIPRILRRDGLATEQTHTIALRSLKPATAIGITRLDRWFIPGDETCDIHYYVEGLRERADKVDFEVYASHYAKATAQPDGDFLKFSFTELDIPIRRRRYVLRQARTAYQVPEWRGESEAADGALKPRPDQTRYINAAFSPYTILLRYFKAAADANARIRLDPFWVEFETPAGGEPRPRDESLRIRWRVSGTAKLKHGQIIVWDKDGVPIFRKPLAAGDLSEGNHEYFWQEGRNLARPEGMPYRVQIQAHTDMFTDDGLALAVAHTEVRLWCHAGTGRDPATVWDDPVSLELSIAPFCPPPPPPPSSVRFFKQKLAAAGYHPGPIDDDQNRNDFKVALKEFQRSWPVQKADGTWERLEAKGNLDDATKNQLRNLPPEQRPMFGDPASLADLTLADASARLADPSQELVVWVDDRHCYTESEANLPGVIRPPDKAALENYRGEMEIGDNRVAQDRNSIPRPWIPVQVLLPLLSKNDALDPSGTPPRVTPNMRHAIGPLRVDWTFAELPQDASGVPSPDKNHHRARRFIEDTVQTNCPETLGGRDCGGIRPQSTDAYYKAAFGFGPRRSLLPWLAYDDSGTKTICSLVHDDLGQASDKLHDSHVGAAGVYLRPSRIAGDGYVFCAQVSFKPLPGGNDFPNRAVLEKRYPKRPLARTAGLRVWRKTSFRGYIGWLPAPRAGWQATMDQAAQYYRPAYVHFVAENGNQVEEFPVADLITPDEYKQIVEGILKQPGSPYQNLDAQLSQGYVWPYLHHPHYGIEARNVNLNGFLTWLHNGFLDAGWRKYRAALLHALLRKVEIKYGRLRGHLLVEFSASPRLTLVQATCDQCGRTYTEVANDPTPGAAGGLSSRYVGRPCDRQNCGGTFQQVATSAMDMPLPAVGVALGACWLFDTREPAVWAHEIGHHRHLQHAQGSNTADPAPGAVTSQHDSAANPHLASAPHPHQRCWDRYCIMSYDRSQPQQFCGKCLLRNRGWAVETITPPAGNLEDP